MATGWILRSGTKRGHFRYRTEKGTAVLDRRTIERADRLGVPPAWTDVHIAASAAAAVQAWGFDARGRKQYRYHDREVQRGQLRKFYRVREMAKSLPAIRRRLARDLHGRALGREAVCAAAVRLIGAGFFRVGNDRYAKENRTFGLTTLRKSHVAVDGECVTFAYRGKHGIRQRQVVVDRELARFVARLLETPGTRLFRYQQGRTWGGTLRMATILADMGAAKSATEAKRNVNTALRLVAAELGNTPAICRSSYVHPIVIARYLDDGATIARTSRARRARAVAEHAPEERALIAFLDEYFPERRRTPRSSAAEAA